MDRHAPLLRGSAAGVPLRLARFLDGPIFLYGAKRALPAENGTSRLSQDLRHGLLSIREVLRDCRRARAAAKTFTEKEAVDQFVNELNWREFYMQVLCHWPEMLEHEFQPDCRSLSWRAYWRPEDDGR